jgi:hypothetical protein
MVRTSSARFESVESYLFSFSGLQALIFVALAIGALRWPTVLRRLAAREAAYEAKYPSVRGVDSIFGYKMVMGLFVLFEALLLLSTVYRSVMLATNSI